MLLTNRALLSLLDTLASLVGGETVSSKDSHNIASAVTSLAFGRPVAATTLPLSMHTALALSSDFDVTDKCDTAEVADTLANLSLGLTAA